MSDTDKFRFGNGTCPPIEVDTFTPVCSSPPVDGSAPLSLDVPLPVFNPVIPPVECACFTFKETTADVAVTMHPGNSKKASGQVKMAIKPVDDCCDGVYEIDGPAITLDIPECVRKNGVVSRQTHYYNKNGNGYGGSLTVELYMEDCVPKIRMRGTPLTVPMPSTDISIGSGGSVFQGADHNLYTDGGLGLSEELWYGGGIGNLAEDDVGWVECRGPLMRCGGTVDCGPFKDGKDHYVPYTTSGFRIVTEDDDTSDIWYSWSANEDRTGIEDLSEEGATGNLHMVLPTGFQWDNRGIAINLCGFRWNQSGLLNSMYETGVGVLVSPPPAVHDEEAGTLTDLQGKNASGLCMFPTDAMRDSVEPGLMVKVKNGLRIFGADNRTSDRAISNASEDRIGSVEVYGHSGDFLFNSDGKLVINDEQTSNSTLAPTPGAHSPFSRDQDYTIITGMTDLGAYWDVDADIDPGLVHCMLLDADRRAWLNIVGDTASWVASLDSDTPLISSDIAYGMQAIHQLLGSILAWANTWYCSFMHIGKAGTILSVDLEAGAPSLRHYTGNTTESPDDENGTGGSGTGGSGTGEGA